MAGEIIFREQAASRRHAELILPMAEMLLAECGLSRCALDAVAVSCGPGGFTGVRIGIGVAQGIALGLDIPALPISTLAALAQGAFRTHNAKWVATALDARMDEVYWGCYTIDADGIAILMGEECVAPPSAVAVPLEGNWIGAGEGWRAYGTLLPTLPVVQSPMYPLARDLLPNAVRLLTQGNGVPAELALPVYLRNQVVQSARNATTST